MGNKKSALEQTKRKVIDGVEYTLQMVPASWYLDAVDSCKDNKGNIKQGTYMRKIIEGVVVSPRVSVDDFTGNIYALRDLMKAAEDFITGGGKDEEKNEETPAE